VTSGSVGMGSCVVGRNGDGCCPEENGKVGCATACGDGAQQVQVTRMTSTMMHVQPVRPISARTAMERTSLLFSILAVPYQMTHYFPESGTKPNAQG
jgi:hypothetical protein